MAREKILSITRDDFEWEYFRAGGKGGQNQNKTATGVRVRHLPSGAIAESRTHRDQLGNRREAFRKITSDPKFVNWLKVAVAHLRGQPTPEQIVEKMMEPDKIKVEIKKNGRWIKEK